MFLGVDVSATRGLDLALLGDGGMAQLFWLPDASEFGRVLGELGSELVVGIDAPSGLARQAKGRRAEEELRTLGISSYATPSSRDVIADWVAVGFGLWAVTRAQGFVENRRAGPMPCAVEVYPYLAYVCWSGARRPQDEIPAAWAKSLIARHGIVLPPWAVKDHADAVAAALVARAYANGTAIPFGDPDEGVIWAPCPVPATPTASAPARRLAGGQPCLCGCGEQTSGRPGVVWRPGHDMRGSAS